MAAPVADLTLRHTTDGPVITARGELDLVSAPCLRELLVSACRTPTGNLALAFADVTFCDSLIAGLLAGADLRLRRSGYRAVVCGARPQPERVIRHGGLDHLLDDAPAEVC